MRRLFSLFGLAAILLGGCAVEHHTIRIETGAVPHPSDAYHWPLSPQPRVLSPFGRRGSSFHTGCDLQLSRHGGEAVQASRAGRVIRAGTMNGYGHVIDIRHADGYVTRYAHLRGIGVRVGQHVDALKVIGTVGQTGRATTPHLHFEIITPEGRFIDPLSVLNAARD